MTPSIDTAVATLSSDENAEGARLAELWNTFTDAWLEGGPENANNVLIRVTGDSAEYWDTPGGKVTQLANLVKATVTGKRFEGDNETVHLDR